MNTSALLQKASAMDLILWYQYVTFILLFAFQINSCCVCLFCTAVQVLPMGWRQTLEEIGEQIFTFINFP